MYEVHVHCLIVTLINVHLDHPYLTEVSIRLLQVTSCVLLFG